MLAEIFGPDLLIVLIVVVVVLFGGAAIPKLARNLGSAQSEFKKGLSEAKAEEAKKNANQAVDEQPTIPATTQPTQRTRSRIPTEFGAPLGCARVERAVVVGPVPGVRGLPSRYFDFQRAFAKVRPAWTSGATHGTRPRICRRLQNPSFRLPGACPHGRPSASSPSVRTARGAGGSRWRSWRRSCWPDASSRTSAHTRERRARARTPTSCGRASSSPGSWSRGSPLR